MYVILVYDIKTDENGQKVLNKTFKICKKYLSHIQNSVFEGDLLLSQITKLKYELESIIRKDKDSIIIFMRIGYLKICGVKKKINPVILFNIKNAYI